MDLNLALRTNPLYLLWMTILLMTTKKISKGGRNKSYVYDELEEGHCGSIYGLNVCKDK